jgi:hypothetical protein
MLLRPNVLNIAATLPLLGSRLPIPNSRISNDSPTKSAGSRPAGCAVSMEIVAVAAGSAVAVPEVIMTAASAAAKAILAERMVVLPIPGWGRRKRAGTWSGPQVTAS